MFCCLDIRGNRILSILRIPNGIIFRIELNAVCTNLLGTINEI
jgi:hypothetical protein